MKKILLSCFLTWCFCFPLAFSKTIKDIQIKGNAHIEKEAICNEIPYKCGSEYDESTSNQILKILNKTGYFDDVSVFISNDIVFIDVVENPTIRQIAYEGMNFKMKDALKDMVKIKKRQVLSKPAIQETQQLILEMYRRQGYLSASVTVKIVKLPNNNVDVVFEVKDGSPAYVRKISFIGNKALRSSDLRESMEIKEKKWFHLSFLGGTRNKIYDPEKFVEDQQMLVKYYMALGYADFEIVSANAELSTDKKNFFLTYYLKEGEIYKFGKITVESKIPELDAKFLQAGIIAKEGALFNGQMIELCGDILKSLATARGYNFAAVAPVFKKDPVTKTVDVCFVVKDGPKVSVEKVVIKGNRHTRDSVIRAEIDINEGDPYDTKKMKRLEERIKGLGFFKNVRVEPEEGSDPDHAVLVVTVDEEKTGEAFVKGGWSSLDHLCIEGRIFEPNFRGKGQSLEFSLGYAGKVFEGSLELAEPNLFGNRIYGSATLFHTRSKKMTNIKRTQTGIGVTMGYHLSPRITQTWGYRLHRENVEYSSEKKEKKVDTGKTATEGNWQKYLKTDEGKEFEKLFQSDGGDGTAWGSAVTHTLSYDRRNRRMLPSKGFRIAWTTKVSGLGGSIRYMINTWSGSIHQKIYKDIIFTLRASFSHACGIWGKPLRKPDALYLGGDSFRGFDFFGLMRQNQGKTC
ncbi:outer membrane protein assembly factor BamA [Alphaproteobacteria bacterium]|nr:outer membrane protein assembly factor BamA [Alphaproteobacteria bacterium]